MSPGGFLLFLDFALSEHAARQSGIREEKTRNGFLRCDHRMSAAAPRQKHLE